jgi:hypothetical protein
LPPCKQKLAVAVWGMDQGWATSIAKNKKPKKGQLVKERRNHLVEVIINP